MMRKTDKFLPPITSKELYEDIKQGEGGRTPAELNSPQKDEQQRKRKKPKKISPEIKTAELDFAGKRTCADCGSGKIRQDRRGAYCGNCGLVVDNILFDLGPEWRAFDWEQKNERQRTGGPLRFGKQNQGLTTEIDKYDRDIKGSAIPAEKKESFYRLRKWQKRSRMGTSVDRNLSMALPELDRICSYLNIHNNIKEECARKYRQIAGNHDARGRSIESTVAALVYSISRNHGTPYIFEELAEIAGVPKKAINQTYKHLSELKQHKDLKVPAATPKDYVPRYASELGVSGETEERAMDILEKMEKIGTLSGKTPYNVAVAAICLATGFDEKTYRAIDRLKCVTTNSVKRNCKEIGKELGIGL